MNFQDPTFWVAVAFCVLVLSIWMFGKNVRQGVSEALDDKAASIRQSIDEAQKIYDEAYLQNQQAKLDLEDAKKQAQEILDHTKIEIDHYQKESEERLTKLYKFLEDKTSHRMERGRANLLDKVEKEVKSLALQVAQEVIERIKKDPDHGKDLVQEALEDIKKIKSAP